MAFQEPDFTILDHTADLGMCVRAPDLKTLFEDAAIAMMMIMIEKREKAAEKGRQEIRLEAVKEGQAHWGVDTNGMPVFVWGPRKEIKCLGRRLNEG